MTSSDDIQQPEGERPAPFPSEPPATRKPGPETAADDADTEGHLFSAGPSTQGEAFPKIPGGNPHGDR